jgi:hypothetical protein
VTGSTVPLPGKTLEQMKIWKVDPKKSNSKNVPNSKIVQHFEIVQNLKKFEFSKKNRFKNCLNFKKIRFLK